MRMLDDPETVLELDNTSPHPTLPRRRLGRSNEQDSRWTPKSVLECGRHVKKNRPYFNRFPAALQPKLHRRDEQYSDDSSQAACLFKYPLIVKVRDAAVETDRSVQGGRRLRNQKQTRSGTAAESRRARIVPQCACDWRSMPIIWCRRPDSNRHGLRHCPLKTACLPIPPRRQ